MRVLRTSVVSVAVATLWCLAEIAAEQPARSSDRQTLMGVWELVSLQDHRPNGEVLDWMGKRPTGTLIYSPDGHMSVQIMRDPRPTAAAPMWASDGRDVLPGASANEIRDAYGGYYAYFGTWAIDERARTVTHHIRGSLRAVEVGADYVRPYEFSGDHLLLRSTVSPASGEKQTRVITWRRAGQTGGPSVQYRSPEGVEYRSLPDTDAVKTARAALDADPKNITRIIELGVAQSGARQFREAIATFTRGLEIEPNHALLLRWRGHRYLSVREFDRAFADLTRGAAIDSTIYGIWYHLGIVQYLRGDFAEAAASFAKAQPIAPDAGELAGSTDWLWMSLSRAGRGADAKAMLDRRPDSKPVTNAYTRRLQLYRGEIGPDAVVTPADTEDVQVATLAYGLGNWYLVRGDTAEARQWFERSIQSGGWPGFGFIVSEVELRRLRGSPVAQVAGPQAPALTPAQIQASQALAQKYDRSAAMEQARHVNFKDRPVGAIVQKAFDAFANYLIIAAQMMPEPGYGVRPTPDVRTFGEQINHATGANYSFCNQAGVPPGFARRNASGLQSVTTKSAIVKALEDSVAYCSSLIAAASEAWLLESAPNLGGAGSGRITGARAYALIYAGIHGAEDYGTITTYLRMQGLVPPSTALAMK